MVGALPEPLSAGLVYPVSSSGQQQGENKHQAVAVHDGCGDVLSCQVALVPIELQLVGEALGLLASLNKLHDDQEPPVAALLLFLQQAEAGRCLAG